ncbi:MAG: acetyltransferase [Patescibacteria group bacterium]
MDEKPTEFEGWALLELMGHRKLAGYVKPATIAGSGVIRIDVPSDPVATQFYSPAALYCLTPITEDLARKLAHRYEPSPVSHWELPASASIDDEDRPF